MSWAVAKLKVVTPCLTKTIKPIQFVSSHRCLSFLTPAIVARGNLINLTRCRTRPCSKFYLDLGLGSQCRTRRICLKRCELDSRTIVTATGTSAMAQAEKRKRVCIIGSGNWGSAIAKIVGLNVLNQPELFEKEVLMYVYEEVVDGVKLTDIINMEHENVKYLPDIKISPNVIAVPDVVQACTNADILIFVLPHQFVKETCEKMIPAIKEDAVGLSLIKGFVLNEGEGIQLVSNIIKDTLGIETAVLMGANLATEVASEMFCETTIACENPEYHTLLSKLFQTSYFRVKVVTNVPGVEACGALKNVVGIGAGIVDGLGFGDNTKAAVIRLGLMEMIKFTRVFLQAEDTSVFFESCGIADLVATCHGGRNRLLGEAIVKSMKDIRLLEKEILRGQSFQGPLIAKEIYIYLKERDMLDQFPLFVAIHRICIREVDPRNFIECLRDHPEHM